MTTAARSRMKSNPTATDVQATLAASPEPEDMTAEAMLAELRTLDSPLSAFEQALDDMRERRLRLWCAARLLPKDEGRPIFMALAEASNRSEALVIKATQKRFADLDVVPPR